MNLTDIIREAPDKSDKNMVPMGGGGAPDLTGKTPFVAGNPADDADKSAIPQDTQQDADKQIDAQDIAKLRPAIKILMPNKPEQSISYLVQALKKLVNKQSISVKMEILELRDFVIEAALAVVNAAGVSGARRQDQLKRTMVGQESIQQEIDEGLGYAMPSEDEESERVSYSKTKKQGDASVTVSANADSMDELHDILRLAGIDFEKSGEVDHTPDHKDHDDHEEPEMEPKDDMDQVMVISPADASMSTDKEVLTNYLKDKLKKSLS